ncbi:MAG: hypothetical protein WC865_06490 [Bacteroidales bacterium]
MKQSYIILILFSLLTSGMVNAQGKSGVRPSLLFRAEGSIGYVFFTGTDASEYTTSVKGLGSALWDVLNMRQSLELLTIGTDRINLTTGIGNNIVKYRFAQNLVPSLSESGAVSFTPDADSSHNYVNTFFGYGKTKLVNSSFYIPLNLNLMIGENIQVTAGGFADWLFFAKYKMKYLVDDLKVKEVIKSSDILNFPFNRFRYGLHAGIYHHKWGMGLAGTYCITPVFKSGQGPDIHECRVTVLYGIKDLLKESKKVNDH